MNEQKIKPLHCAWCSPNAPKYYAQKQLRHAKSHGMCVWHLKKWTLEVNRTQAKTQTPSPVLVNLINFSFSSLSNVRPKISAKSSKSNGQPRALYLKLISFLPIKQIGLLCRAYYFHDLLSYLIYFWALFKISLFNTYYYLPYYLMTLLNQLDYYHELLDCMEDCPKLTYLTYY